MKKPVASQAKESTAAKSQSSISSRSRQKTPPPPPPAAAERKKPEGQNTRTRTALLNSPDFSAETIRLSPPTITSRSTTPLRETQAPAAATAAAEARLSLAAASARSSFHETPIDAAVATAAKISISFPLFKSSRL